jgi:uncharacterized protein
MSQVGRNDPCPCGSGLKFKKCCLNKAEAAVKSYSSAERQSALAKLMRFSEREEFREIHKLALQLFWGDWLFERRDEDIERVMDSEQVHIAYSSWFAYDFDLGEGRTLFELFLERESKRSAGKDNVSDIRGELMCRLAA